MKIWTFNTVKTLFFYFSKTIFLFSYGTIFPMFLTQKNVPEKVGPTDKCASFFKFLQKRGRITEKIFLLFTFSHMNRKFLQSLFLTVYGGIFFSLGTWIQTQLFGKNGIFVIRYEIGIKLFKVIYATYFMIFTWLHFL